MPHLSCHISQCLENALSERARSTGESISHLVAGALAQYLNVPLHTLFQVSTSGALVQGVYQAAVSAGVLKQHGTFGLGTFEDLDGEMIVLGGQVYQAKGDGTVKEVSDEVRTPFAVITRFQPDDDGQIAHIEDLRQLAAQCDGYRKSDNVFHAFQVEGRFDRVHTRAMAATRHPLAQAATTQPEFTFQDVDGTLVGIWSPEFSQSISVPGYHFHFISADRKMGGHLLDCAGSNLRIAVERLTDFHISLPESEEFLKADLSKNTSADLAYAEQLHK